MCVCVCVCVSVCSVVSHGLCDPMDCRPPGFSVHGIFQARIMEQVLISYSRESSQPRDWTQVSCIGRQILYHCATWKIYNITLLPFTFLLWKHLRFSLLLLLLQSCPTLCDLMDGSPPGSPVPAILQARTLEWIAIYF